jgi:hypothetical protein
VNPANELDPQELSERAFSRALQFSFRGKPLEPWTYIRKKAARAMGLRWGFVPDADFVTVAGTRLYKGWEDDALLVVWILHQPIEIIRSATVNPAGFQETLEEWIDSNDLMSSQLEPDAEAVNLFVAVMTDEQAATGVPQFKGEGSKKNQRAGSRKKRNG